MALDARLSRTALVAAALGSATGLVARPASAAASRALTYGARGRDVRALNERLAELTYLPPSAVTAAFGEATYHAVVAFQKYEHLRPDGVAGRQTRAALARAAAPVAPPFGASRRIDISLRRQLALLVEGRRVTRTVAVSTGRTGYATPAGRFEVYRRERRSWSRPYRVWLPWAAYFTGGIALHAYPDVPPYPASHGCVRVPVAEARVVYRFATLGTRVIVV